METIKKQMATTEATSEDKIKELIVLLSELSEGDEYFCTAPIKLDTKEALGYQVFV